MKKAIFWISALVLVSVTSCNKGNGTPETWSFEGTSYNANSVSGQTGLLVGTMIGAINPNNIVQISCIFHNNILPTTSGNYTVVKSNPGLNQVAFNLNINIGQAIYNSTGGNGSQKVAVSVSGGEVSIVGSHITLSTAPAAPIDSSATFSINITQQQ